MAKEKERKFLPNGKSIADLTQDADIWLIKQGYLMLGTKKQLRVRVVNNINAFLCYKSEVDICYRNEYEYEIPLSDGIELFDEAESTITKKRYSFDYESNHIDIDFYEDGDIVIEVEYKTELIDIPFFCGEEVTNKEQYSNIYKALQHGRHYTAK